MLHISFLTNFNHLVGFAFGTAMHRSAFPAFSTPSPKHKFPQKPNYIGAKMLMFLDQGSASLDGLS